MKHTKQILFLLTLLTMLAVFVGCSGTSGKMASADAINGTYQVENASGNATMIFDNEENTLFYSSDCEYDITASGDAYVVDMVWDYYGMKLTYSVEKDDDGNIVMTPDTTNLFFNDGYSLEDYIKTLTFKEGTDGLTGSARFDGTYFYTANENATIQFFSDGVCREGYLYDYSIDETNNFTLASGDNSADFIYDVNDDGSEITISDDEGNVMYNLKRIDD